MNKIAIKWNTVSRDYDVEDKGKLRQLPANIRRSILNQITHAAKFTRIGIMDKQTEVEYDCQPQ